MAHVSEQNCACFRAENEMSGLTDVEFSCAVTKTWAQSFWRLCTFIRNRAISPRISELGRTTLISRAWVTLRSVGGETPMPLDVTHKSSARQLVRLSGTRRGKFAAGFVSKSKYQALGKKDLQQKCKCEFFD